MSFLESSDLWIVNHTTSITLTIIFTSVFIGVVVIPDFWKIYKYFKPTLILNYIEGNIDYLTPAPLLSGKQSLWVRASIINHKTNSTRGCKAYLTEVIYFAPRKKKGVTILSEPHQLSWANALNKQLSIEPLNLLGHLPKFFDIVAAVENDPRMSIQIWPEMNRYLTLFQSSGLYYMKVTVVGEDANPSKPIIIKVKWDSTKWDNIHAELVRKIP